MGTSDIFLALADICYAKYPILANRPKYDEELLKNYIVKEYRLHLKSLVKENKDLSEYANAMLQYYIGEDCHRDIYVAQMCFRALARPQDRFPGTTSRIL